MNRIGKSSKKEKEKIGKKTEMLREKEEREEGCH